MAAMLSQVPAKHLYWLISHSGIATRKTLEFAGRFKVHHSVNACHQVPPMQLCRLVLSRDLTATH
jgi:hypothetical protein